MQTAQKKQSIEDFKDEWKSMWRNRIDDKRRAEGIADKDYSLLSVERGTVIIATRKFKLLDFKEILLQGDLSSTGEVVCPNPSVGGWGKFVRTVLVPRDLKRRGKWVLPKHDSRLNQQPKKGGRGWLHVRK